MFRSSFWKIILNGIAGLAVATMLSAPVAADVDGPEVNWRIALFGKPRAATQHLERMKEFIEAETNGKFSITLGYGTLGNPK
ncbi:MAG: hypothetical protein EBZ18_04365, partial [Alphaproteobacteria bacterium]|nr:hypothetical protein [Alphaproteobacteria bacterium]